jgi:hypothetical protein
MGLEGGAAQATHFFAAAGSTGSRSGRSPGIATALEKAFQSYLDEGTASTILPVILG